MPKRISSMFPPSGEARARLPRPKRISSMFPPSSGEARAHLNQMFQYTPPPTGSSMAPPAPEPAPPPPPEAIIFRGVNTYKNRWDVTGSYIGESSIDGNVVAVVDYFLVQDDNGNVTGTAVFPSATVGPPQATLTITTGRVIENRLTFRALFPPGLGDLTYSDFDATIDLGGLITGTFAQPTTGGVITGDVQFNISGAAIPPPPNVITQQFFFGINGVQGDNSLSFDNVSTGTYASASWSFNYDDEPGPSITTDDQNSIIGQWPSVAGTWQYILTLRLVDANNIQVSQADVTINVIILTLDLPTPRMSLINTPNIANDDTFIHSPGLTIPINVHVLFSSSTYELKVDDVSVGVLPGDTVTWQLADDYLLNTQTATGTQQNRTWNILLRPNPTSIYDQVTTIRVKQTILRPGNPLIEHTVSVNYRDRRGPNLARNPGFELGTTQDWIKNGAAIVTSAQSVEVHSGFYAGLVTNRSAIFQGIAHNFMPIITHGARYNISVWLRLVPNVTRTMKLTIRKQDGLGAGFFPITSGTVSGSAWTQFQGQYTFTATGVVSSHYVFFEGGDPLSNTDYYIDDLTIEKDQAPFFDKPVVSTFFDTNDFKPWAGTRVFPLNGPFNGGLNQITSTFNNGDGKFLRLYRWTTLDSLTRPEFVFWICRSDGQNSNADQTVTLGATQTPTQQGVTLSTPGGFGVVIYAIGQAGGVETALANPVWGINSNTLVWNPPSTLPFGYTRVRVELQLNAGENFRIDTLRCASLPGLAKERITAQTSYISSTGAPATFEPDGSFSLPVAGTDEYTFEVAEFGLVPSTMYYLHFQGGVGIWNFSNSTWSDSIFTTAGTSVYTEWSPPNSLFAGNLGNSFRPKMLIKIRRNPTGGQGSFLGFSFIKAAP